MRKFSVILCLLFCCAAFASDFRVKAGGRDVEVTSFRDIHYVSVEGSGRLKVKISAEKPLESCEVSPVGKGVTALLNDGEASFTLPDNGWWMARLDGEERLFIFYEKREKLPDGILATAYPTLQDAFDAASGSGRTLIVPEGEYVSGTLRIGPDSDIYIARGAVIRGTDNRDDFPSDGDRIEADHINHPESYSDNGERMTFSRMILIEGDNVTLRGRGVIDGNGTVLRAQGKPANLIRVRNSRNVLIEGLILRNPAAWNTHILGCTDVTIRGVKIINDPLVHNTDGIDPDSSTGVLVENCFAYCSDDNIAIKSTNNSDILRDVEDIVVRDCVFLTRKSSLKVGTETKAQRMRNILFEGNQVLECDRAFVLYCNDGAEFSSITFRNNTVERNWPDSQRKLIHFKISRRSGEGRIRDVRIELCRALTPFPKKSEIYGLDSAHLIEDVTIRDCEGIDLDIKTKNTKNINIQ